MSAGPSLQPYKHRFLTIKRHQQCRRKDRGRDGLFPETSSQLCLRPLGAPMLALDYRFPPKALSTLSFFNRHLVFFSYLSELLKLNPWSILPWSILNLLPNPVLFPKVETLCSHLQMPCWGWVWGGAGSTGHHHDLNYTFSFPPISIPDNSLKFLFSRA